MEVYVLTGLCLVGTCLRPVGGEPCRLLGLDKSLALFQCHQPGAAECLRFFKRFENALTNAGAAWTR